MDPPAFHLLNPSRPTMTGITSRRYCRSRTSAYSLLQRHMPEAYHSGSDLHVKSLTFFPFLPPSSCPCSVLAIRPEGIAALINDTSVGDPASVGVAVLMANWTKASRPDEAMNDYNTPLVEQLNYLLYDAPRTDDGAISHRSEQVQLWYVSPSPIVTDSSSCLMTHPRSDFVYMVPPFLAYYGALNQPYVNDGLLYDAYLQINLYRNYLFDATPGLWRHVALGDWQDIGYWSTGNGWAAAGAMRVLVTMNQTSLGTLGQFAAAQRDLQNWATEIVNNIWTYQVRSCLGNLRANLI